MVTCTVAFIWLCHFSFLSQLTYSDSLFVYLFLWEFFYIYAFGFKCYIYPATAQCLTHQGTDLVSMPGNLNALLQHLLWLLLFLLRNKCSLVIILI